MPWLFLLLALVAFAVGLLATSLAVAVLSLLAALVFLVLWILGLLAQRLGDTARDELMLVDPQELKRLREQAEARRGAGSQSPPSA